MNWVYGITTVPERRYNYLPQTLESLRKAGFDKPTLFVDGHGADYSDLGLKVIRRGERILAFGNWYLALAEMYIRNPKCPRFAIFQDDILVYSNLRQYLETKRLDDDEYWNLLCFPQNEDIRPPGHVGWYPSNQRGRGAVGLVFNRNVVFKLLSSPTFVAKPLEVRNPHRSIDGVIVTALNKINVKEKVHWPTLVWHTGDCTAIGNTQHKKPDSWMGEEFDAMSLIPRPKSQEREAVTHG